MKYGIEVPLQNRLLKFDMNTSVQMPQISQIWPLALKMTTLIYESHTDICLINSYHIKNMFAVLFVVK